MWAATRPGATRPAERPAIGPRCRADERARDAPLRRAPRRRRATKPIPTTPNREERRPTGRAGGRRDRDRRQRRRGMFERARSRRRVRHPDGGRAARCRGARCLVGDREPLPPPTAATSAAERTASAPCAARRTVPCARCAQAGRAAAGRRPRGSDRRRRGVRAGHRARSAGASRSRRRSRGSRRRENVPDRETALQAPRRCRRAGRSTMRQRPPRRARRRAGRPEGKECRADERSQGGEATGRTRRACRRAGATAPRPGSSTRFALGALPAAVTPERIPQLCGEIEAVGRLAGSRSSAASTAETRRRGSRAAPTRAAARLPGSRVRPPGSERPRTDAGRSTSPRGARRPTRRRSRASPRSRGDAPARCTRAFPGTSRRRSECPLRRTARGRSRGGGSELVAVLDEDVRGLDVAVDDPARWACASASRDLSRDLDGVAIGERAGADRLAERPPGHVLVRDVDVARVVADVVRPHAALVPEAPRRQRLALGTCGRLALPRDDLQRDLSARSARRARAKRSPSRRFRAGAWGDSARGRAPGWTGRPQRRTTPDTLCRRRPDSLPTGSRASGRDRRAPTPRLASPGGA